MSRTWEFEIDVGTLPTDSGLFANVTLGVLKEAWPLGSVEFMATYDGSEGCWPHHAFYGQGPIPAGTDMKTVHAEMCALFPGRKVATRWRMVDRDWDHEF
jgi:hypothetical protein